METVSGVLQRYAERTRSLEEQTGLWRTGCRKDNSDECRKTHWVLSARRREKLEEEGERASLLCLLFLINILNFPPATVRGVWNQGSTTCDVLRPASKNCKIWVLCELETQTSFSGWINLTLSPLMLASDAVGSLEAAYFVHCLTLAFQLDLTVDDLTKSVP